MDLTGVVHLASVGGGDNCLGVGLPAGCDKSFALVAVQKADGTTSGQWEDNGPGYQIHIAVDCLEVVGNIAIMGGVVTQATGAAEGQFPTGRATTEVVDNGTSTGDTPDQISLTIPIPADWDCEFLAEEHLDDFPLYDLINGQVTVH